jgi:hypothetical protein
MLRKRPSDCISAFVAVEEDGHAFYDDEIAAARTLDTR